MCAQSLLQSLPKAEGIHCPTCREVTPLPEGGVAGLPGNFHHNVLTDITEILKRPEVKNHCPKHPEEKPDYYCETCDELFCKHCLVPGHKSHEFNVISVLYDKHKKVILNSLKPAEEQIGYLGKALEVVSVESDAVKQQEKTIVTEIHTAFEEIRKALGEIEHELVGQAKQMAQKKLNTLITQHKVLEQQLDELKSCQDHVTQSTENEVKFLEVKTQLLKQVEDLTSHFKPQRLFLAEQANIKFSCSLPELEKSFKQFCKVGCSVVCPSKCQTSGNGIRSATRGHETLISIKTLDQEGDACIRPVYNIRCELVASDGSSRVRAAVRKRIDKNIYDITYQPEATGKHQLHILINEQHILNSPFTVTVTPNFIIPARHIQISKPKGLAVTAEGDVVVAESGTNRLSTVNNRGRKRYITSNRLHLNEPEGVAIDAVGNTYVIYRSNSRILRLSPDYNDVNTFGGPGNGPLQFNSPVGIAIHHLSNKVYIADTGNHRIQILNSDLTYSSSFGKKGSGNGEFNHPCDIAIDRDGHVYVADRDNNRIQVFTADGNYIRQFGGGRKGGGEGEGGKGRKGEVRTLHNPVSISISYNIVYVVENYQRISISFIDGDYIRSVDLYGCIGLATDKNGSVYVSNALHNVSIYT